MGLLEEFQADLEGVSATCDHLVSLNDKGLIGCESHDKFILPEYPPASSNHKCKDWERRKTNGN